MSGRLTQVAAVAVAVGGLYVLGSVSSVLTEHQPPEPKASRTVIEKDSGRTPFVGLWPRPRADAPVAGRAAWRMVAPDQRERMQSGRPSRH